MELNIAGGLALKTFTRSLNTLLRLSSSSSSASDIDFTCTPERLSLSVVNPSRTAFGVAHFYERFFAHYAVEGSGGGGGKKGGKAFKFAVTGKALLQALRPRTSSTVESVSISVGPDDPGALLNDDRSERSSDFDGMGGGGGGGATGVGMGVECRVVVKLFCQHGVVKTHRLTYSNPNVNNWAKFDKDSCTSGWVASGRVLKDWLDHFHLSGGATGASGGAADEITFYCSPGDCRLKSFNEGGGFEASDPLTSRASLSTELIVDVDDFDMWDVAPQDGRCEVVTFGLKEFKSIISLCDTSSGPSHSHNRDAPSLPLSAHFTTGGRPLLLALNSSSSSSTASSFGADALGLGGPAGHWEARFVIATTDYDSGGGAGSGGGSAGSSRAGSVKRETPAGSAAASARGASRAGSVAASARGADAGPGPSTLAARQAAAATAAAPSGGGGGGGKRPLFNPSMSATPAPPSQSQRAGNGDADEDEDDEYGGGFDDFDEGAFAEIDRLSQVAASQVAASQQQLPGATQGGEGDGGGGGGPRELVRDTSEARPSASGEEGGGGATQLGPTQHGRRDGGEGEDDEEMEDGERGREESVYGDENDERAVKKPRWNLYGDG
ncbi:hypothetical protein JCM6882_002421 [Rhodosporidiobolus microsporus]